MAENISKRFLDNRGSGKVNLKMGNLVDKGNRVANLKGIIEKKVLLAKEIKNFR